MTELEHKCTLEDRIMQVWTTCDLLEDALYISEEGDTDKTQSAILGVHTILEYRMQKLWEKYEEALQKKHKALQSNIAWA